MFVIFHVNVHKACFFCEEASPNKNARSWATDSNSIPCEIAKPPKLLHPFSRFFPQTPQSSAVQARSHRACPDPLPPRLSDTQNRLFHHLFSLSCCSGKGDPQARCQCSSQPRLGYFRQGCAPKVTACLHTLCAAAAISVSIFRGSPPNISPVREKDNY